MSAENKPSLRNRIAESTQRFDLVGSGVAVVGSLAGLIPIGFTVAFIEFGVLTYLGSEVLKEKKNN